MLKKYGATPIIKNPAIPAIIAIITKFATKVNPKYAGINKMIFLLGSRSFPKGLKSY